MLVWLAIGPLLHFVIGFIVLACVVRWDDPNICAEDAVTIVLLWEIVLLISVAGWLFDTATWWIYDRRYYR